MNPRRRLGRAKRVLIKIGSRALVNARGELDHAVFDSVAHDVAGLRNDGADVAIVSSGAILAGRARLGLLERELNMPRKQAAAAVGQNVLMAEWGERLDRHGLVAGQVLVTAEDLGHRARYLNSRNTIEELLRLGVVPVINENDTVAVEEIRYGDNDHISTLVAVMMRAEALILLTDIDGLCVEDPAICPGAAVVPLVHEGDDELFAAAGPSHNGVGSGGMGSKIEAARAAARRGAATVIANAKTEGIIARIMAGEEVGTLFVPDGPSLGDRKYWMAFGGEVRGVVVVDEGAARAVESRGRSLLPSGVIEVRGEFGKGDLVAVTTADDREIARGLTHFGSNDLSRVKGHKSSEIENILGQKLYDEVIHRDYLALTGAKDEG